MSDYPEPPEEWEIATPEERKQIETEWKLKQMDRDYERHLTTGA